MKKYKNRNSYRYEIKNTLEAGISLTGSETKAIKTQGIQLDESIAIIKNGQLYLINALIPKYRFSSDPDYDQKRPRKLLISKKEIKSLISSQKDGLTIIPLSCYNTKRGWIKVKLGIGKIKKKRQLKRDLINKEIEKQEYRV